MENNIRNMEGLINLIENISDKGIKEFKNNWMLGTVDSVISTRLLSVFLNGSTTAVKIPCSPDITYNIGDSVIVVKLNGDPKNKFVISHSGEKDTGGGGSTGDMLKSVYDTDNDGKVNSAEDSDALGGTAASAYAKLASPAFSATPTAPTASVGTNTTQLATTAFVNSEIANDAPAETVTTIGNLINGATAKATPVDADAFALMDSASSNIVKKLSWLNLKATLKTYFDGLYSLASHTHTYSQITDFADGVRATVLTGLSTATNAVITASDTVLSALGKLQKQISDNLTTLTNHTGNTSNPHSVTASQVGLGNVTNESKATMFTSPAFTATPTAPTAANGTNTTQIATTAFVNAEIASDAPAETTTTIGNLINGATAKATPVDADMLALMDSASSNVMKKLSWSNVKATLKTYFDGLYSATGHTHTASQITDFADTVRATVLTGLSTATNAVITASDTVLSALGKLQKQISDNLTTLTNHTGNTSNPHSVTASQVGLGNVTNESKATMFTSPALTATPTAPTAVLGTDTTQIATTEFVQDALTTVEQQQPIYTTTTAVTEGWYRIATVPIGSQFKQVGFRIKGYTATGTTTESTIFVNIAYYSGNYGSQYSGILANTSHSYLSQSNAENGYVFLYCRVSFDATSAYIDMYKYKTTAVTIETQPLNVNDWVWATGALTVNPTVGAYRNAQVTLEYGVRGNRVYANYADASTYSSYGVYGAVTKIDATDKTGQWAYFGYVQLDYNSSYLEGRSVSVDVDLIELSQDGSKSLNDLDVCTVRLMSNLGTHTDSATFNSTIPTFSIDVYGKTSLTSNDFCGLVYSTSTSQKIIRFYIKLKGADTIYHINPQRKYGRSFNSTTGNTTSYCQFYYADQQTPIVSLPTPAQGSVAYATFLDADLNAIEALTGTSGILTKTAENTWSLDTTDYATSGELTAHTGSTSNPHSVTASQVGLGNVDNTADSTKNVLSATKLTNARTIGTSGGATGTATNFDGSANITIPITNIDPYYIGSGYTKNQFYIDTHPENGKAIIPFINNDIAFLLKKGGSASVYYDDVLQSVDISNVFDGSPSYWAINPTGTTSISIELSLHKTFTWTNTMYVSFGASAWRSTNITFDVMNTNNGEVDWTNKATVTGNTLGEYYITFSHNNGTGFNKMRLTFSGWVTSTIFRLAQIGLLNYGSEGVKETYISRGGSSVYGNIYPHTDSLYSLGDSSHYWSNVYADTLTISSTSKVTNLNADKLDDQEGSYYAPETTTTIGNLINGATIKATPVDADMVALMDSASSNVVKKLSWSNIKATMFTSPALTATPTAPTATAGNNTTQIATTAFVQAAVGSAGGGDMLKSVYDTDNDGKVNSAEDADALGGSPASDYAKLASPAFSATPTAPTATAGTDTTQIATTAFVQGEQRLLSGSALPTAGATYRGKVFILLGGTGEYDIPYVCLKKADESYAWYVMVLEY